MRWTQIITQYIILTYLLRCLQIPSWNEGLGSYDDKHDLISVWDDIYCRTGCGITRYINASASQRGMTFLCVLTVYYECTLSSLPILSKTLVFYWKLAKTDKNLGMKVVKNPWNNVLIKCNREARFGLSMRQNPIKSLCMIIMNIYQVWLWVVCPFFKRGQLRLPSSWPSAVVITALEEHFWCGHWNLKGCLG